MPDFNVIIERVNSAILSRDYGFAEKLLNSCLKKTDGTPPEHLLSLKKLLGKLYIRSGNSEKGLTLYKELSAEHPRDTEILNDLGVIYRKLNLLDKSASILEEARTLNRDEADTLYNLGKTYQQSGNYEKAVGCFSRVLEINPEDVLAYNHLGTLNLVTRSTVRPPRYIKRDFESTRIIRFCILIWRKCLECKADTKKPNSRIGRP